MLKISAGVNNFLLISEIKIHDTSGANQNIQEEVALMKIIDIVGMQQSTSEWKSEISNIDYFNSGSQILPSQRGSNKYFEAKNRVLSNMFERLTFPVIESQ